MTRALALSDLHFEFHRDGGEAFVASLRTDVDAVILAGDITNAAGITKALTLFAKRYSCPIVYVHGNHEFYGSDRSGVIASTDAVCATYAHVHWLDNEVFEIGGRRILGTPMWFRRAPGAPHWAMNDYGQIRGFDTWVHEQNLQAIDFFYRQLHEGDVVVTHYLPTEQSVHAKHKGSPLNPFFLCDVKDFITARRPSLWIHGHTHESIDYVVGGTRVVCNPFGYLNHEVNAAFDPGLVVDL